jgi:hypothetical protein
MPLGLVLKVPDSWLRLPGVERQEAEPVLVRDLRVAGEGAGAEAGGKLGEGVRRSTWNSPDVRRLGVIRPIWY